MSQVGAVYRVEVAKLAAQWRLRAVAVACLAGPPLFLAGLGLTSSLPTDALFGRQLRETGWATPLLLLTFCGAWVLPLLSALVAGDVASTEDGHGTWQLLLTRVGRGDVLAGKALAAATWSVLAVALLATSTIASGLLVMGDAPLLDLSGATVQGAGVAPLVVAAWLSVLPPVLGYTALALLLSVATRSSAAGIAGTVVVGLVLQLATQLGAAGALRPLLLATPFTAWHGLLLEHRAYVPLLQGAAVSAGWVAVCLLAARALLLRRDVGVA